MIRITLEKNVFADALSVGSLGWQHKIKQPVWITEGYTKLKIFLYACPIIKPLATSSPLFHMLFFKKGKQSTDEKEGADSILHQRVSFWRESLFFNYISLQKSACHIKSHLLHTAITFSPKAILENHTKSYKLILIRPLPKCRIVLGYM